MKLKILFFLFVFGLVKTYAQNRTQPILNAKERNAVNQYIIFTNNCNHYLNTVSNVLNQFNNRLNKTYEAIAKEPSFENVAFQKKKFNPQLTTIKFEITEAYNKTKAFKKDLPKKRFLLLDQELDKIYKQTKKLKQQYNTLLQKNKEEIFSDAAFKPIYSILQNITLVCETFVDINYSFSIASVIFYGKQTALTPLLAYLNDKAAKTKDLIMGVRQQNKKNVTLFYNNFKSLKPYSITQNDIVQLNAKGIQITLQQLKNNYYSSILKSYQKITQVTETYLNKDKNNLVYIRTLSKLIKEFDYQATKSGIAYLYNDLVSKSSKVNYKLFVEEPLPFGYWLPKNYKKNLQIALPKKENIQVTNVPTIGIQSKATTSKLPQTTPKVFVKNDTKTLYGAKTNNLVLLLDVSRSMHQDNKLPLLKNSIIDLVNIMRPDDKIAIIVYSGESKIILTSTTVADKDKILKAIEKLTSAGGTNVTTGLRLAYNVVLENYTNSSNNKIILATDGDFKITTYLHKLITQNAKKDIDVSVFHYGNNSETPHLNNLKTIATLGNGHFKHINSKADATKALILEAKQKI